jgi:hypothetical protein
VLMAARGASRRREDAGRSDSTSPDRAGNAVLQPGADFVHRRLAA